MTQTQEEATAQKWSNRRKWFLWIGGAVLVYIVLYLIGAELPGAENAPTTTTAESPTTREATTATLAREPITVSGRGQSIADVELTRGLARFSMKHEGSGYFSVHLLTVDGQRAYVAGAASETLLASGGGVWEGQKAVRIDKAGPFVLDVSANGPWQVTITY